MLKNTLKENLKVNEKIRFHWKVYQYEYKLPVAFIEKDRVSRNIVDIRELIPEQDKLTVGF